MNILKNSLNWQPDLELVQLTRKRYRNAKNLRPHMNVFGNCRISINYLFERLMANDGERKVSQEERNLQKQSELPRKVSFN